MTLELLLVAATHPDTCRVTAAPRSSAVVEPHASSVQSRLSHNSGYPLQVISIDRTPGTTMCVIGLGSAVAKQWGTQEGARSALPVMTPCLAVAELTPQQYSTAMRCVLWGFWRYCVVPLACTAGCTAVAA